MKTLFDKIKPDVLKKVYDKNMKYKSVAQMITDELKEKHDIDDLSFRVSKLIYWDYYGYFSAIDVERFYKLFND